MKNYLARLICDCCGHDEDSMNIRAKNMKAAKEIAMAQWGEEIYDPEMQLKITQSKGGES
jgi:hypothetical protein